MTTSIVFVVILLLLVVTLYWTYGGDREREVEVLSRDQTYLKSDRLGLSGRPDRMVRLKNGMIIPKEKKSSNRLYDSHRIQVGAYLLLIEEVYGTRPSHGLVELGDGRVERIDNTKQLQTWTINIAEAIRAQRADPAKATPVRSNPRQCRSCGVRDLCHQRAA